MAAIAVVYLSVCMLEKYEEEVRMVEHLIRKFLLESKPALMLLITTLESIVFAIVLSPFVYLEVAHDHLIDFTAAAMDHLIDFTEPMRDLVLAQRSFLMMTASAFLIFVCVRRTMASLSRSPAPSRKKKE